MSSSEKRQMSESGMLVYPKLPVPKQGRESEPRLPRKPSSGRGLLAGALAAALLAGAAAGFFLRPRLLDDPRVLDAEAALAKEKLAHAESQATITKLQNESKQLDEQRALLNQQLEAAKQAQDMLADKTEDANKLKQDLETAKKKLDGARAGTTTLAGNAVHLTIPASSLFKGGDELSPAGTKLLDRLAGPLKELADKQVAVHGHTDDQPPPRPPAPKPAKPAKPARGKKAPPPPPPAAPPAPEFATNWELSAARALAVVHYLQDKHKIVATRLSALAFSQYRPVSKANKAANRRIEIVLTPKPTKK
jgi:chemotaxis protein MotB